MTLNKKIWEMVDKERQKISLIHLAPKLVDKEACLFSCRCGHDYEAHEWDCGMIFCDRCKPRCKTFDCTRWNIVREKCHARKTS